MRVVIIGFMGSGKSVVGRKLAKELKMEYVDMDTKIEEIEKRSITDIFKEDGEVYFRNVETKLLKDLTTEDNIIISTGGGVVSKNENIDILKNEQNVILLDASVSTIKKNVSNEINKRPLLKESKDVEETIKTLLSERIDKYNKASNIKINVDSKNIDEVVSEILVYIR
ncbi:MULTISPECIES: shikimate kinase [unclassified Romboutsia]|uniref:shikimate kinase n=1 Tax=unclassified Romboutsia TaxID=2626894 RepID=UPI00189B04DE|nr:MULTISPECIES: shikimate kinase [unclassified Romboutsia]MDB8804488.1 shikimate kinase [Romboutsia sp. 1001216sp1]MDB8806588.1 shikimate kinase [Romboutsia sp. 1001216sp1]MDB8810136.1 shikimate kinase [Romboutsia sp. 1001216sp1]MDB8815883.1 shikimate kinase [Romboutsia sp. 1001216sp1]MDB8818333.1 shikimate kinase [Romboutsia sp. 1001216sp1]